MPPQCRIPRRGSKSPKQGGGIWGQAVRRYSDEVPVATSASSQSATRHSAYSQSTPRYTADAATSKHSGKRRDSQSSGTRHQKPADHHRVQQDERPVSTYSRSTSKYHDPGGFGPPPKGESSRESSYYAPDTRSPRASGAYLGSRGYDDGARSYQPPVASSMDPLAMNMGKLRIDEMTDNAQYTAVPLPGPANPVSSTPLDTPSGTFQDQSDRTQWPIVPNSDRGVTEGTYQPGASTEAADIPVSQPSAPSDPRHIVGTPGSQEPLDPKYIVRNYDYQRFFREGRVFSTLWTDPVSWKTNRNQTFVSCVAYGEKVHTKIRRFVVVRQRNTCCNCLPVTSYEGRGAKKHGISLDEHSQIYSDKHPPKKVHGMSKKALRVIVSKGAPKIKDSSLVNYGRIYTVECNVKVMDIGTLDDYSRKLLLEYYNADNFRSDSYPRDRPIDRSSQGDSSDLAGVGAGFETVPQSSESFDSTQVAKSTPNTSYNTHYSSHHPSGYSSQSIDWNSNERGTSSGGGYRAQVSYGSNLGVTQPTTTSSFGHSSAPVYDMNRTSSTIPSTIDPRYIPSSDPAGGSGAAATPSYSSRISDTGAAATQDLPMSSNATTVYHTSDTRDNYRKFNRTLPSSSQDYRTTSSQGFAADQGVSTTAWAPQQPSSSDPPYPSGSMLPNSHSPWSSAPQAASSSRAEATYDERRRDEGEVIVLPTREEAEASRVQRTRRQSSSRPHGGQDRSRYIVKPRDRDEKDRERDREREKERPRERNRDDERRGPRWY